MFLSQRSDPISPDPISLPESPCFRSRSPTSEMPMFLSQRCDPISPDPISLLESPCLRSMSQVSEMTMFLSLRDLTQYFLTKSLTWISPSKSSGPLPHGIPLPREPEIWPNSILECPLPECQRFGPNSSWNPPSFVLVNLHTEI